VPIYQLYQQPAKPQLTSSDHEVVATCRLSGMSEVGRKVPLADRTEGAATTPARRPQTFTNI